MRDYRLYVKDILESAEAIEQFVEDMDFDKFRTDDKTTSAVIRKFEIIGEAAKHVPDTIRDKYPTIAWKEKAGMRDKLIHFYMGIKYELVWQTIKDVIPRIKPVLRQII